MANEIQVTAGLLVKKGGLSFSFPAVPQFHDQTGLGGPTPGYLTIGTTEESVSFSELSTAGWCVMQNLDGTNYVQWGFSAGVYGGRMNPGETAGPFRLEPGTTLRLKANAAACKVLIYALES